LYEKGKQFPKQAGTNTVNVANIIVVLSNIYGKIFVLYENYNVKI